MKYQARPSVTWLPYWVSHCYCDITNRIIYCPPTHLSTDYSLIVYAIALDMHGHNCMAHAKKFMTIELSKRFFSVQFFLFHRQKILQSYRVYTGTN